MQVGQRIPCTEVFQCTASFRPNGWMGIAECSVHGRDGPGVFGETEQLDDVVAHHGFIAEHGVGFFEVGKRISAFEQYRIERLIGSNRVGIFEGLEQVGESGAHQGLCLGC